MAPRRAALSALPLSLALASPLVARGATDLHFDYTSFEATFGQAQFDVLNYPSINGNYMNTSTDAHRPEMVANGNELAEFYNWLTDRYAEQTVKNGAAAADVINTYTVNNSTNNGPRPTWIVLNEISSSLWGANPGSPSISTYRTWLMDCVTRLTTHHGYKVVTLAPFQNPGQNNASWQALSAIPDSYIGIECYLSGTEVWNSGPDNAARLAWAQAQYQASKNSYMARGVPANRLFVTEHFANNNATYVDNQGNTQTTGWGRAGLASAADWDTVIQLRQDAIYNVGFDGFLAYNWGGNAMGVTQAEQIQHEYYYRSRLVLPTQQRQWLSDAAINVNGTVIPLSWGQPLNWIGGVPNAAGAVANFYRTNTAARTVTLDGDKTVGTLTFNSLQSYTIAPGTGGALTLGNGGSAANVSVAQGSHTIAANLQLQSNAAIAVNAGTLTISGVMSGAGALTKNGAGTLALTNSSNVNTGVTTINAGVVTVTADTCLGAAPANFTSNALTLNGGTWRNVGGSAVTIPANRGVTVLAGGGTLDFSSTAGVPALNAKISGTGTLTKMGVRTLQVGSDSSTTFAGNLLLKQGRLNVNTTGTVNPLGTGAITLGAGNGDVTQLGMSLAGGAFASELGNAVALTPTGNGVNSFEVNAGNTLTLSGVVSGAGRLQKSGGSSTGTQGGTPLVTTGTLVLKGANTYTGGTTVNAGTLVAAHGDAFGTAPLTVNTGALAQAQANLPRALRVASVAVAGTGKLDLTNDDMVVTNSNLATVRTLITQGYNGGNWLGNGITSSAAAGSPNASTALGFASNADLGLGTFSGVGGLDGNDVLVKYTYYGDADLTGVVDTDDFQLFLAGYQDPSLPRTWLYGDFDYSGVIDTDDFQVFLYGYQNQGGPLNALTEAVAEAPGLSLAERGYLLGALAAVPEPGCLAGLAVARLLVRRRKA